MAATTLPKVLEDTSAVQPVPKTTVAETMQLQQDQNFDLTLFYLKTFGIVVCGITAVLQICYDLLHM